MKLDDIWKPTFADGETFYSKLGEELLISRGKPVDERKISSTAKVKRNGESIKIVLFETPIATFRKRGGVVLNSGGWRTRFTREKINQLLPKGTGLYSDGGLWVVHGFDGDQNVGFLDGMVISEQGIIEGGMAPAELSDRKALLKKSSRFCRRFIDRLLTGKVGRPGPGDCLYCQVEAGSQQTKMGVLERDGTVRPHTFDEASDHIVHHIDEGYFVPSLLHNAIMDMGGPGQLLMPARVVMQYCWAQEGKGVEEHGVSQQWFEREKKYGETVLRRVLHKYLKKRLGCEFGGKGWQSRPS